METTNNNDMDKEDDAKPEVDCKTKFMTGLRDFGKFMWNSDEKTFMGRTFTSWVAILSYYVLFYAFLAGFWAACLAGFLRTIDYTQPTQQGNYSLLKANPGMTYEPMLSSKNTTLIGFNKTDNSSFVYREQLDTVLKPYFDTYEAYYDHGNASMYTTICDETRNSSQGYTCLFDPNIIPPACRKENNYGYTSGAPCIFLRPNKVYGFEPQPYGNITAHVEKETVPPESSLYTRYDPKYIGVSCDGENDGDRDNILHIDYYPPSGFPFHFYPYLKQDGYLPPFVMAQFKVVPGRVVMVWCRIWASNIKHDKNDVQGSIHFELMVDV